ncbi:DUF1810 family protein [Xylophilus sp. Kf1]|nr:DUF1810 family protein [Xylophilus sp. Kf1]
MTPADSLERFVEAQAPVYRAVCAELAAGDKRSHWMWFVFPQLRGLGRSETARWFGLADAAEALAYWRHPVLGPRLVQCCELLLAVDGRSALQIFGSTDALKLRSCMTLFIAVAPETEVLTDVLRRYCDGEGDPATTAWLAR